MDPIASTEARRQAALGKLDPSTQAVLGQFFTPVKAAMLMASMLRVDDLSGTVRVLDPGAGAGSLTAALVDRLHTERPDVAVHVVAVEADPFITPYLRATLEECQAAYGISYDLVEGDYLLDEGAKLDGPFDLVIANPPYGKLASDSPIRLATAARAVTPQTSTWPSGHGQWLHSRKAGREFLSFPAHGQTGLTIADSATGYYRPQVSTCSMHSKAAPRYSRMRR